MRAPSSDARLGDLPWKLLGVHSARLDLLTRDVQQDESLGLNCAWYADILLTLTRDESTRDEPAADPLSPAGSPADAAATSAASAPRSRSA